MVNHSLALRSDGTVVAWGSDYFGQARVPAGLTGVTAIAAGGSHSLALRADGTVVAWGVNRFGQTRVPAGLTGVTAIAAGELSTVWRCAGRHRGRLGHEPVRSGDGAGGAVRGLGDFRRG